MTLAFFSNFLVPHQVAFCREMRARLGQGFVFVATQPFQSGQVTAGFSDLNTQYDFCLPAYRSPADEAEARRLVRESDVVLLGAAPESWLRLRMRAGGLTFRVSERLFKPAWHTKRDLVAVACTFKGNTVYARRPLYLLAAGAYAAADYAFCGAFRGKAYKWGYFPGGSTAAPEQLLARKAENAVPRAVWAGRMIDWKHPEAALAAAAFCRARGLVFRLDMIGSGPLEADLRARCAALGLDDGTVEFTGALPNENTLAAMEQADILLATSDENEGWGAVVNEGMQAACAVIASRQMGSVPYLLRDGANGLVCPGPDGAAFGAALAALLGDPARRRALGLAARETVAGAWSAAAAAENLCVLCQALQAGGPAHPIAAGPCSSAEENT